jgi:hypothetical protein
MAYTQKLIQTCQKQSLTIEQYLFCTLVHNEFAKQDAYILAYRPITNNPKLISKKANETSNIEEVKNYLQYLSRTREAQANEKIEFEKKTKKHLRIEIENELQSKYEKQLQAAKDIITRYDKMADNDTITDNDTDKMADILDGDDDNMAENKDWGRVRTKDMIIRELNSLLDLTLDLKTKTEIYKQLADLQNMKKEQEIERDDTIHYYLPLSCNDCNHNKQR